MENAIMQTTTVDMLLLMEARRQGIQSSSLLHLKVRKYIKGANISGDMTWMCRVRLGWGIFNGYLYGRLWANLCDSVVKFRSELARARVT